MILLQLIYNLLTCIERTGKFIFCLFIQIRHCDLKLLPVFQGSIFAAILNHAYSDGSRQTLAITTGDWIVSQTPHIPF